MSNSDTMAGRNAGKLRRSLNEAAGFLRCPQRVVPLFLKLGADGLRTRFETTHLYSYTSTTVANEAALHSLVDWILRAQWSDGGVAAYYSLLTGYSESYPEVTGYIIPTLYDFSHVAGAPRARDAAERATNWLMSLQMPSGAFPGGLHGVEPQPSIFNTGQILQGVVRAYTETRSAEILKAAIAAGDWLVRVQQSDGSWSGPAAYQGEAHTYYSMVSLALAQLSDIAGDPKYANAASRNVDWVLTHAQPSGWIEGINLQGHPTYLHFVAYVIQGVLECGILLRRNHAIEAAARSAWVLLRRFETHKRLPGTFEDEFKPGRDFTCLTGNAQMSCVWLRLYEITRDLRYLNAALKMNEMLKQLVPERGRLGVIGGVAGSYPIWGAYQPMRYISWGAKFFADALLMQEHLMRQFEAESCAS